MLEAPEPPPFPAVGLVVSGGHTSLYLVRSWGNLPRLGATIDDAMGEAFDKAASILGLPFPVVIDAQSPSTVDEWGPGVFPFVVLLDTEGKLQAKGSLEDIEKRLEKDLK